MPEPRDDSADRAERGEAPPPAPPGAPASPRSPRPPAVTIPGATPGGVPPPFGPVFVDRVPQQRSSLSSMMMMMMMFFFMSGGNAPQQHIIIGPDGEIQQRVSELDLMRETVAEYKGYLNGTTGGNWTEAAAPDMLASTIVPGRYDHSAAAERGSPFFNNITGWYRRAKVSPVNLTAPVPASPFFPGVHIPSLDSAAWNETHAAELRGEFNWSSVNLFDMKLSERWVHPVANETNASLALAPVTPDAWAWVSGVITLTSSINTLSNEVNYDVIGLHHVPNGTYEMYAMPEGVRIDYRNIPRLYPSHANETRAIILGELEEKLRKEEQAFLFMDAKSDEPAMTHCPLLLHFAMPPLPPGVLIQDVLAYERELANPTGILTSLTRPPNYWDSGAFGGVVVADGCGWAFSVERGKGVGRDDYWRKGINYAAYATISQLIVLVLLVRQMEATRTPSTLAKVSIRTIVLIFASDAWIFSAHLAVGVISTNKTSLPMMVPGFLSLCCVVVFAPRYTVLLHRIQAPENSITAPPSDEEGGSLRDRVSNLLETFPAIRWVGGMIAVVLFLTFSPSLAPPLVYLMHSVWVPQIWRNARRGFSHGLQHSFVVGTSIARLAIPLYVWACPENVFFFESADWVWGLLVWLAVQITVLFAQDRFGPGFFLPKRFAPAPGYDYHPILPVPDAESGAGGFEGGNTCSICMEDVNVHPAGVGVPPAEGDEAGPSGAPSASALLAINARRAYAVAPCHHLFHTKCLQQWMTIKTICPLCKRPLPPL